MSKNVAMFVDVANMYYAARGQDVDVDYVALLKHATKGRDLIRAYAYTGLDPDNENQRKFIDFLGKNGYKPVIKDIRKFGDGRMKANLDIELVVDLFRLADRMDIAVIVSGDGDFAPAIRALQDTGVRCEVISFKPNTSSDLIAVADEFMDIMKVASISRKEGRASRTSMSAPEMPAKEVSPEFGFRDASPSVAAAALAAIKGGGSGNGRRSRSGSSDRRGAAPSEEPPGERVAGATATEARAEATEETHRRRRRRGGRGRGRSRHEESTPAATGSEEIGWEELDDISQLDGADEAREYTFEEADAATLAELGISPDDVAAETPAEDEKPKRRTRAKAAGAPADEAKPKRSRAKKADAPADEAKPKRTRAKKADAEDGAEEAKPKRGTRTASSASKNEASADAGEGSENGEPQGIWGRFRSARKPRTTTSS
ncbi:MAG TPA: NYN domain-containing protein [Candidatus Limnocylindria bacterium]|nr:NYN domain-containing protein [Candidatus Limnocylindria bacterium]